MSEVYQLTVPFKLKTKLGKKVKRGPISESHRQKIIYKRQFQTPPNLGRVFCEEVRENMSKSHIGKKGYYADHEMSAETKKKISDGVKRYWANKKVNK